MLFTLSTCYNKSLRGEPLNLRVLIRQPLVFPETLPLLPALEQFRNARTHFAFVVDEFGSVEGIVTLSDVTETIAGNLPNEVEEIDARHDIQKNADGSSDGEWSYAAGGSGAICRCRWMKNVNITPLPGY